jgi:predicted transport protein
MALFKINGSIVKKITAKDLDLEKRLQSLFEQNLDELLNIIFLAHEYSTSFGGRIDTLGMDKNGSPCIIEYKKNQNDNVINQGLSYLKWLLDHKEKLEILCQNKKLDVEIDWDSPRVICIAESYSKFDLDTADILPIKIELLRYRIYDENILYLEPENYQKVKISTSGIIKKEKTQKSKDTQLQKVYSIDDHLAGINKETLDLFQDLRERVLSLDQNIIEEAKAKYIAYKTSTNFVDVVVKQYGLKIFLNIKSGQLDDPQNIARDLTKPKPIGHWGNGDYEVKFESAKDTDAVFSLIKQSYAFNK